MSSNTYSASSHAELRHALFTKLSDAEFSTIRGTQDVRIQPFRRKWKTIRFFTTHGDQMRFQHLIVPHPKLSESEARSELETHDRDEGTNTLQSIRS